MSVVRCFIAIDIPESIKKPLLDIQDNLKSLNIRAKYVEPENLHINILFLGEVAEKYLDDINSSITSAIKQIPPFNITITGVGFFPDIKRPRVAWLGVYPHNQLLKLHNTIKKSISFIKTEQRKYMPHLTLGRIKSIKNIDALRDFYIKNSGRTFASFMLYDFFLKKSTLTPSGPVYKNIFKYTLKQ